MLDRHIHRHAGDTHVKIEQKPHDAADTARLYGELKDRALKEAREETIGARLREFGAHNELKVVSIDAIGNFEAGTRDARFIFELNGDRYDISVDATDALDDAFASIVSSELVGRLAGMIRGKWRR